MTRSFVPAAGHDLLLPFYDPLWRLLDGPGIQATFIRDAGIVAGQRILDIGCGTGSLAIRIAETTPDAAVTALDPDENGLARGRQKAARAGVEVRWREGFGDDLPYPDASFDRVTSTFMFHHLDLATKRAMLREARRVLCGVGQLHVIDFDEHHERSNSLLARLLRTHGQGADAPDIAELLAEAGFEDVREVSRSRFFFGPYAHIRGSAI